MLTRTKPFIEIKCLFMLALADTTTEVFSFLLLLPLEIAGQWMSSQSLLSFRSYRYSTGFLSWNVKLKLIVLMPILTDTMLTKFLGLLCLKKCLCFNGCWSVHKVLLENVFLVYYCIIMKIPKSCCCWFHCFTWLHQSSLNSVQ